MFYFTLLSEITNLDSGILCYLHRRNPVYSGPYLPRQNVLECSLQGYDSCLVSSFYTCMLSRFCVFPVLKQQVLLHLFSFLLEVAKHLVTNATLSAETTSHRLLFAKRLANNHTSGEIHPIEPAIVSWKIPCGQRWCQN